MYRSRCRLLGLIPLLSVLSLHSQTATPDAGTSATIKSRVRLVLVDVVVTNGKGEAVTGLHKNDFQILENGKPQTISTIEEHHGAAPTQIKLPTLPPHVYTNFPVTQTADSLNVLLLDALNTPSPDQTYVHTQMLKYLKTIPPGTRVAIFTLASRLRMLQGVTSDSSELLAALNSLQAGPQQSPLLPSSVETDADTRIVDFMMENSAGPSTAPATRALAEIDPVNAMKEFLGDAAAFQTRTTGRAYTGISAANRALSHQRSRAQERDLVFWFLPHEYFPGRGRPRPV